MHTSVKRGVAAAAAIASVAICAILISSQAARGNQQSEIDAQESLDRIAWQFASLQSIAFSADVSMIMRHGVPDTVASDEIIEGTFNYKADGDMWYKSSVMPSSKYPGMNTEIAYDGTWYQYHMRESDVMGVSAEADHRLTGMTLPNPILMLARFMNPLDDSPDDLLLREIRSEASEWITRPAQEWEEAITPEGKALRAVLPGATYQGSAYDTHFYVADEADGGAIIIEQVRDDGSVIARSTFTKFTEYENNGDMHI